MKINIIKKNSEEKRSKETITVKELKIEVEKGVHHKGEKITDLKIPEGWRLLRIKEIIFLHNNEKYRKELDLENTWEYIEQEFEFNRVKGQVVAFYSSPYGANFYFNRSPLDAIPNLGARFCRDLGNKKN